MTDKMGKPTAGAKFLRPMAIGLAAAAMIASAVPAGAQFLSDSYNFLKAVRERDANKAIPLLDKPGAVVNTKDYSTGETGLIIATRNRDTSWMALMMKYGGKTDLRDRNGDTALTIAARTGFLEGARFLLDVGADVNLTTASGETPILIAVQKRDLQMVRLLLGEGGNPKLSDRVSGKNAIDYAQDDIRAAPILKLLNDAKPKAPISGPVRP
jgi:ankyrin repeat protein